MDYLTKESLISINNSLSAELEVSNNEIIRLSRHCDDRDRIIIDKDDRSARVLVAYRTLQTELTSEMVKLETAGKLLKICIFIILTLTGVLILK